MLHRLRCTAVLAAILCGAGLAHAAPAGPTLDGIRSSGVITIGVRDNSFPFSYLDNENHYLGFSVDISNAIVAAIKKKLAMPGLRVRELAVTSQNRIPLLQNNQIQFECSSTTHNVERSKQVNFSDTFFVIGTRLMVPKGSPVKDFADLKDKTVVTVAGSTSERILRGMNEHDGMRMRILSSVDAATAFVTLETGRAGAYMMDDPVLAGGRATAHDPGGWEIVGEPRSREAYGCMLPKDDAGFKELVDQVMSERQRDGTETANYRKWFLSPTPPKNVNLKFDMTPDIQALYAHPDDKPLQ
ncbi:transporter substrate-binding domain-containing protein [Robbsia sp. Bb-Pol-6]|uniref:Transporter substrate-binding domain-containing protein n=1 Tax=Robbsia betulipollinis TaxID=2981849 RepID=A0ABT3ZQD9_9BURK|nr:transporter substrate-binding domain-containing protein [Robbsia betulipollinis]